jgi:hypothetical protein
MPERKSFFIRALFSVGAVVLAFVFVALLTWPKSYTSNRISVKFGSNGTPRLYGVSLANTNVRDAAFKAVGALGLNGLMADAVLTLTNGVRSNVGILITNIPPSMRGTPLIPSPLL